MSTSEATGNFLSNYPRPVKTYHAEPYPRIHPSNFSGKGKTVLITGGATGIGRSIAQAFAETGIARVVIVARSPGPLEKAKQGLRAEYPDVEVLTYSASLTDYARMHEVLKEVGSLDILVHSAAATHDHVPIMQVPTSEMQDTYDTNVVAPFDLVKSCIALPKPFSGGPKTVINISSGSAHMQIPNQSGYGSSKAAFVQIMASFTSEYTPAKDAVRLFSVHPGAFYTPLAATQYGKDDFDWEDIRLPGHFCTWLALGGTEPDFLHGRFVWAHWDVDELVAMKESVEGDGGLLKIGLIQ